MNNLPKTIDEHREYLFEIVKLKLFFLARWQKTHPEEEFSFILRNRVDIFRKTDLNPEGLVPSGNYFDTPRWLAVEKRLQEIYSMVNGDEKCFEEWGFDYLRPAIERRCERDFYDRGRNAAYNCGFLRHNPAPDANGTTLGFHIANDREPDSFFDDPGHIKECFKKLLDAAEQRFKVSCIGTGTWLNSVPKWLDLFPQEYQDNLGEPDTDIRWHYGFWGQFINARGCFNAKAAAQLRKSGQLPYLRRYSFCSIRAMREHLETL